MVAGTLIISTVLLFALIALLVVGASIKPQRGSKQKTFLLITVSVVAVFLLCSVVSYLIIAPPFIITDSKNRVRIGGLYGVSLTTGETRTIRMEETLPGIEQKIRGIELGKTLKGDFLLEDTGEARLILFDSDHPPYLYIRTGREGPLGDRLIIFNLAERERTEQIYDELRFWNWGESGHVGKKLDIYSSTIFTLFLALFIWLVVKKIKGKYRRSTNMENVSFALGAGWLVRAHELEPKSRLHDRRSVYAGNWMKNIAAPLETKIIFALVLLGVAGLIPLMIYYDHITASPVIEKHYETLEITGLYGVEIEMDHIVDIRLENTLPGVERRIKGIRLREIFRGTTLRGDFVLKELGEARLMVVNTKRLPFIYIQKTDGLVILNYSNEYHTEYVFAEIEKYYRNYLRRQKYNGMTSKRTTAEGS